MGFEGTVLIPERRDWQTPFDYMHQVEWEFTNLEACTVIAFWVPRQLPEMLGLTTNVEFGRYVDSGRCVYGRPDGAPHTGYLDWLYKKMTGDEPCSTLKGTLLQAIKRCREAPLVRVN